MYSLLVFGRSACHYKVCSLSSTVPPPDKPPPAQEWKASEIEGKKEKDAAATGVDLMRVRIPHDNAQKLFFYPSFNSREP